ncbi:MAG: hypothetical protein E6I37_03840 [Chloroflexi bacterium]|nr:MAG: hypothetical protein E6I37_03840 [Chloroflexota bacterium]
MSQASDARLANLLGALATGLTDGVHEATSTTARLDEVAAAALIALLDFSPRGSVQRLSQVIGLTHSGTVRLVDRLVNAGYARHIGKLSAIERATLTGLSERLISELTKQRLGQRRAGVIPAGGALCRMCDFAACGRDRGACPAAKAAAAS